MRVLQLPLWSLCLLLAACCCRPACPAPEPHVPPEHWADGAEAPAEPTRKFETLLIRIAPDLTWEAIRYGGTGDVFASGSLRAATEEKRASVARLREALVELTAPPELREEDGSSVLKLLIETDGSLKWREARAILGLASDPDIRIYKVQLRIKAPTPGEGTNE